MQLPELVEICPVCKGKGQYKQNYNMGCGQGFFAMMGPCEFCQPVRGQLPNLGYRMKDGGEVPASVINQINIMNRKEEK